jgi:hypothetical protein
MEMALCIRWDDLILTQVAPPATTSEVPKNEKLKSIYDLFHYGLSIY